MPEGITWLHLSDLHACTPRFAWDAERVTDTLVEDLRRLQAEQGLRPDLIFFTGDAAFGEIGSDLEKTLAGQLARFAAFLDAVRNAFQPVIALENVFLVPGNHDVHRGRVFPEHTDWLDARRDLEEVRRLIADGGPRWSSYCARLEDYRAFLERHGFRHLLEDPERLIYATVRTVRGVRVGVAGFNTAWSCCRDKERGQLWMAGKWQQGVLYPKLRGADFAIALLHHPPGWLGELETPDFDRSLEQDFRFVLHGHEHRSWVQASAGGRHAVIASAACYERSDSSHNGYNLVRLDPAAGRGEVWLRRYDGEVGCWTPRFVTQQNRAEPGVWELDLPWLKGVGEQPNPVVPQEVLEPRPRSRSQSSDELGAVWRAGVARFGLYSEAAERVTLCLFDHAVSPVESKRIPLHRAPSGVWSAEVRGLHPGQLYGYRVEGAWQPEAGALCNPAKLLMDPLARAITGEPREHAALAAFQPGTGGALLPNGEDSAAAMPRCVLVDPTFDWGEDAAPRTPWGETVLYECHVRGLTKLHPEVAPELRGTYLGLASPPVVSYLRDLGVTALVLLPVQQIASEPNLLLRRLRNYWGYSPLGFCAPHAGYATGCRGEQVVEFKAMVRELHRAGLEVIVDVVLNHTAEGDHTGPVLSLKGIDNQRYYQLEPGDRRRYVNHTGCGNTLDVRQPAVRRLILETLRCWVREMHVDGFRFNLATVLGRPEGREGVDFDARAPLFTALAEDPELSRVKLIAEPWSTSDSRLGAFPPRWVELNDRFRDTVRGFWHGCNDCEGELCQLTTRLAGSSDVFGERGPLAGINFVTYHDGFTLADLVSYERKHNEANGEENRDGPRKNFSRNWGHEGPTEDLRILADRDRARRNLLASLALAQGVPLLLHGDELGRTQQGNNNTFCQDNELSWVSWGLGPAELRFRDFVRHVLALRRRYKVLRRETSFTPEELQWWHGDGRRMSASDWENRELRTVAAAFVGAGDAAATDSDLLLLLNAGATAVTYTLPTPPAWQERGARELLDTARLDTPPATPPFAALPPQIEVAPFSLRLFEVR